MLVKKVKISISRKIGTELRKQKQDKNINPEKYDQLKNPEKYDQLKNPEKNSIKIILV